MHLVQAKILNTLLFNVESRFTDLNPDAVDSDRFTFHINRVIALGLVTKNDSGLYTLTAVGKEYANRFDTDKAKIEKQPKIGVLLVCSRNVGKNKEYLIQQRLKQPFYGYHGFPTGKIRIGETLMETAERELYEETGLKAEMMLKAIKHKMDYSAEDKILEDKFFFVIHCANTKGSLKEQFEGGKNIWLLPKHIIRLEKLFDGVEENFLLTEREDISYVEHKYHVKGF